MIEKNLRGKCKCLIIERKNNNKFSWPAWRYAGQETIETVSRIVTPAVRRVAAYATLYSGRPRPMPRTHWSELLVKRCQIVLQLN